MQLLEYIMHKISKYEKLKSRFQEVFLCNGRTLEIIHTNDTGLKNMSLNTSRCVDGMLHELTMKSFILTNDERPLTKLLRIRYNIR